MTSAVDELIRLQRLEISKAEASWKRRQKAAIKAIDLPDYPYRIAPDTEAGRWFVECAEVVGSEQPNAYGDDDGPFASYQRIAMMMYVGASSGMSDQQRDAYLTKLADDKPTASVEWKKIGRTRRGYFTYTRAKRWLKGWLEPVEGEPRYFNDRMEEKG
jgi:hypothetical protein